MSQVDATIESGWLFHRLCIMQNILFFWCRRVLLLWVVRDSHGGQNAPVVCGEFVDFAHGHYRRCFRGKFSDLLHYPVVWLTDRLADDQLDRFWAWSTRCLTPCWTQEKDEISDDFDILLNRSSSSGAILAIGRTLVSPQEIPLITTKVDVHILKSYIVKTSVCITVFYTF